MAKRRRKLSFFKDKPLPVDFSRDYVIALRTLSRQHKDEPEARKALRLLRRMSREASLAGRGEVWIPRPGPTTGYYPVIEDLPFSKIRTAVRKNTLKRQRAWDAVASSTRPFYPIQSPVGAVVKSLLPAAIVSLPFVRGRTSALLGKKVPGELQMTKRGSIIPISRLGPDEWTQQGFQPLKFAYALQPGRVRRVASSGGAVHRRFGKVPRGSGLLVPVAVLAAIGALGHRRKMQERVGLKKPLGVGGHAVRASILGAPYYVGRGLAEGRKKPSKKWVKKATRTRERLKAKGYTLEQYGWKERWQANKKKQEKKMRSASGWERWALGKEDLTLAQARAKAKKLSVPGTKITVAKGARPWFRARKGKREINVPPHSAAIAHEATHTRQHKKLGRAFGPLYKGAAIGGVAGGMVLAALRKARVGRFRKLSRWAAPAAVAAGHIPQLAIEGGAIKGSSKEKGWKRGAKFTAGTYLPGVAVLAAGAAVQGHLAGEAIRGAKLKSTLARRALRLARRSRGFALEPAEVLIYEKGYQYGLRAFLRRHHVGERLKRGALPAALSGLVLEGLRRAHTEFGIPPTTVDLVPVQRTAIRGEFAPFTNQQLGALRGALEAKLEEGADEPTANEIRKQIGKLNVEVIGRRAV